MERSIYSLYGITKKASLYNRYFNPKIPRRQKHGITFHHLPIIKQRSMCTGLMLVRIIIINFGKKIVYNKSNNLNNSHNIDKISTKYIKEDGTK